MSVKMECDNCHTQVSNEGMGNHGWIILSQQLMFNSLSELPIQGSFCTVSCTLEWLQTKQEKVVIMTKEEEEALEKARDAAKQTYASRSHEGEGKAFLRPLKNEVAEESETTPKSEVLSLLQFSGKAGEILRKVVGTDEPIAIFRARDLLSIFPLARYAKALEDYGAHYDQQESWSAVRDEFRSWQNSHSNQVRLPD